MSDPLKIAGSVAASGLNAQALRMRVVSENMANAQSTASTAGGEPYARKTISFAEALEGAGSVSRVRVVGIEKNDRGFPTVYDPGHPAANEDGYVQKPNVNVISEMADMREASRSYEANLQVVRQSGQMVLATIDLLKGGR